MADTLETMFKHLGPATAGMWAGEREAQNSYANEAALALQQQQLQDLIQKHGYNREMNPKLLQEKDVVIQGHQADLPGKQADSRTKVMQAETYGKTQQGLIDKTNSDNEYTILANKIKSNDALVGILGKEARNLEKYLPAQRHAVAYQSILRYGGPQALKEWEEKLGQISGDKLPAFVDAFAQNAAMGTEGMRQKLKELEINIKSQEKIAGGHDATQLAISNNKLAAAAKAKKGAESIKERVLSKNMTFEQAANAFRGAAFFEEDPDVKKALEAEADKYAQKVGEKAAAGKPDIGAATQGAVPQNQITPFGNNTTPSGKPLPPGFKRLN